MERWVVGGWLSAGWVDFDFGMMFGGSREIRKVWIIRRGRWLEVDAYRRLNIGT